MPAENVEGGVESDEVKGMIVRVAPSEDPKCERCWVHDSTVGKMAEHPTICERCLNSLMEMEFI